MKSCLLSIILCGIALCGKSQSPEQRIKNYLLGYEKKDWNMVAGQFTDDFTFTSPAGDDHISLATYKEKCFLATSPYFKKVEFPKITIDGSNAFAIYDISTTDNKQVHNVEYYTFKNGKIKSIECFFGAGTNYPGSGK